MSVYGLSEEKQQAVCAVLRQSMHTLGIQSRVTVEFYSKGKKTKNTQSVSGADLLKSIVLKQE